jgi:hypothetical protein
VAYVTGISTHVAHSESHTANGGETQTKRGATV